MRGWRQFPGGEILEQGLADLRAGKESVFALVAAIGAPRLRGLGIDVPPAPAEPEHRLYDLLAREDSDTAHSRYNALIRRLVSLERSLECANERAASG